MKLFSFFKKQKESIDIKVPEGPLYKSNQKAKDEEIYFERVEFSKDKYSLSDCKTLDDKRDKLISLSDRFEKKTLKVYHDHSFLRLFSRSALKDNKFNEKMIILEKQINRLKKMFDDLKRKVDLIKYVELNDSEVDNIMILVNEVYTFLSEIESELIDIKDKYFKHLKVPSYSICSDKSYQELDNINKSINTIIEEYKNFSDAYDYIYYNSGGLIVDTINALMECIENSNNEELKKNYTYEYFLSSDYVISISFAEWIELFTKIKYIMRVASKVELFDYLKFKDLYAELEKVYILMLIYNEIKK